jgi:hypothetical protein
VWPGTPGPAERHSVAVMTGRRTAPGSQTSRTPGRTDGDPHAATANERGGGDTVGGRSGSHAPLLPQNSTGSEIPKSQRSATQMSVSGAEC